MTKRVLSIGNCGPDTRAITTMLQDHFAVEVTPVDDLAQSLEKLGNDSYDLVLVNRVLDRDGSDGLEVIRYIKATDNVGDVPVMMITNFPEHQQRAQEAGALEGFGKQALHTEQTRAKLAAVLQ
jgi:two-component system chemotaxis response regulator CheY